ncbi:protein transport protein Yif1p [Diutina catenulata]
MYTPFGGDSGPQNLQHPQPQHINNPNQFQQPMQQQQNAYQPGFTGATQQTFQQAPGYQQPQGFQQPAQGFQQQGYQQQYQKQQQQQQQGYQNQQGYQQGYQQPNQQSGAGFGLFNDQAASFATQFAKSQFEQSNSYIAQNFGSFIPGTGELKFYFQVSNGYVLKKLSFILMPFLNKDWNRITMQEATGEGSTQLASPVYDPNAPDLYIPLMSFVTYILLWSVFQGLKGEFHPELFGILASQTVAFSVLDIAIFKIGLYLLGCSTQSSIWDLVSFSGYKYVTVIVLLVLQHLVGLWSIAYTVCFLVLVGLLSVFLMRSLKFLVLPSHNAASGITDKQRKHRVQFLFFYSTVVQLLIIFVMSRS